MTEDTESFQTDMCTGEIKAFIRGGREGLAVLKRVLPNIFRTYPRCMPFYALQECGLEPFMDGGFPTFYFQPLAEGAAMVKPRRAAKPGRLEKLDEYRSQELLEAYHALNSEWS